MVLEGWMNENRKVIRIRRVGFVEACRFASAAGRIGGDKVIVVRWRVLRDGRLVHNENEVNSSTDVSCDFCGKIFDKEDVCFLVENVAVICKNCYDEVKRACDENGTAIKEI
jgi:hypothetical protein